MSKREGGPIPKSNPKIKMRKGVKTRTIMVAESDEEDPPANASTDYAWLVQTRVTASGKAGTITTRSVPLLEVEDVAGDGSLGANINDDEDVVVGDTVTVVPAARKARKKANDSVSLASCIHSPP